MAITSPGFTDLSISRMMPLIRFEMTFCRPKPTPSPTAPEKTVNAVRSMPILSKAANMATMIKATRTVLLNRTRADGEMAALPSRRLSIICAASLAIHNSDASTRPALITPTTDTLAEPTFRAMLSRVAMVGSSRPIRFSAATLQAVTASSFDKAGSLTAPESSRITTQAVSRLTALSIR